VVGGLLPANSNRNNCFYFYFFVCLKPKLILIENSNFLQLLQNMKHNSSPAPPDVGGDYLTICIFKSLLAVVSARAVFNCMIGLLGIIMFGLFGLSSSGIMDRPYFEGQDFFVGSFRFVSTWKL
jgi:hypothetical protein